MALMIAVESAKNAEKRGHGRAYLARLEPGLRGEVIRQFAPKEKALQGNNRRGFRMAARPGDVFEARRWRWDADRGEYAGGACWVGIQADGSLEPLNRDEAMRAVHALKIEPPASAGGALDYARANRFAPFGIAIRAVEEPGVPALPATALLEAPDA